MCVSAMVTHDFLSSPVCPSSYEGSGFPCMLLFLTDAKELMVFQSVQLFYTINFYLNYSLKSMLFYCSFRCII